MDRRKSEYCYVKFTLTKYNCNRNGGILSYTMKNKIILFTPTARTNSALYLFKRIPKFMFT